MPEYPNYLSRFLETLEKNIYRKDTGETAISTILNAHHEELKEIFQNEIYLKNDKYIWWDVTDEPIVKGEPNGWDHFLTGWAVVEILRIGDTIGASDYLEDIDWTYPTNEKGVQWTVDSDSETVYGYSYGYGQGAYGWEWADGHGAWGGTEEEQNEYYPLGRKEPATGETYYATYRAGCRRANLYNNFGRFVNLIRWNDQSWVNYRKAIKALFCAFLGGPTVSNILSALSTFTDSSNIIIFEEHNVEGWILNEDTLYSDADWQDPTVDTSDGIMLVQDYSGDFDFTVNIYNAYTNGLDYDTIENVVQLLKPAHTAAYVYFH